MADDHESSVDEWRRIFKSSNKHLLQSSSWWVSKRQSPPATYKRFKIGHFAGLDCFPGADKRVNHRIIVAQRATIQHPCVKTFPLSPPQRYLSEGLSVPFARLLGQEHQLLVLLLPLVDVEEAGQQAHQQHEGDEAQHGEDGHGQGRQLVG